MNDYRFLDLEQKLIRDDYKKREIVSISQSGLKFIKSLFWDYPKFLRCYETLFPNNYLDVVELKDKEYLRNIFITLNQRFESKDLNERQILNFINESDYRFVIGALLKRYYNFGHHEAHLFSEFPLGTSFKVDYLLLGKNSHGWHFVFVELEAPIGNITLANGDFGSVFRKGESQIKDWEFWLESNFSYLKEYWWRVKGEELLPNEFLTYDRTRVHYIVVAGRREDFTDRTYRIQREKLLNRTLFIHYDNLLDSINELIESNYLNY
ncbi:Shedu anti-phage system protein SduA domain-containing protein [Acinetobacter wuhouensis]|uniref:DUF4263 domain-containing protein n=1 Tax=Acinetobacter wuhouensis TaxID=1879050 RepID=A0A4V2DMS1_9GAMM|nr:Shedu anti-phage system protein SduA domain-containing protein [Acinetobacter wuhouensis]RZG44283.1 DUF4263 domain-containing protein [Acinetobacter wuhouensis]